MAALFILAGMAIKRKVDDKKNAKKLSNELRYEELQRETKRRLSRSQTDSRSETARDDVVDNSSSDSEDEGDAPPSYQRSGSAGVTSTGSNAVSGAVQTTGVARRTSAAVQSSYSENPFAARMG